MDERNCDFFQWLDGCEPFTSWDTDALGGLGLEEYLSHITDIQPAELPSDPFDELELPPWEKSLMREEPKAEAHIDESNHDARALLSVGDVAGYGLPLEPARLGSPGPVNNPHLLPPNRPDLLRSWDLKSLTIDETAAQSDSLYSPLITYHDPTPLSSPQAQASELLQAELLHAAYASSSSSSDVIEDYDDDSRSYEDDSGSGYNPRYLSTSYRPPRPRTRRSAQAPKATRKPRKARSRSSSNTSSPYRSSLSSASSVPASPASSHSSLLRQSRPRTQQVSAADIVDSVLSCSVCGFMPTRNPRTELARHLNTHTFEERTQLSGPDWVCCGVPLEKVLQGDYSVEDTSVGRNYAHTGPDVIMVGGCGKHFSRKDVYRRHLRGKTNHCTGDPGADWVPGNKRPYRP